MKHPTISSLNRASKQHYRRMLRCLGAFWIWMSWNMPIPSLGQDLMTSWEIQTIAGDGQPGYRGDGGPATQARIQNPYGLAVGPDGDLYFCDMDNHVIRRIDQHGHIHTVAGCGVAGYRGDGGPALEAQLWQPYEICFDSDGNLYLVEMPNHVVRKIDQSSQVIQTIAGTGQAGLGGDGGLASQAMLSRPHSIALDPWGNLVICDIGNHRVRRVGRLNQKIETLSGNGQKVDTIDRSPLYRSPLKGPRALAFDREGNAWLALREGNAIWKMDLHRGRLHHMAGTGEKGFTGHDGPARQAKLSGPKGISLDPKGNVWFADTESHSIRMIEATTHIMRCIAGNGQRGDGPDGESTACQLARPHGIFAAKDGSVYIGDSENHRIRRLSLLPDREAKAP